VQLFYPAPAGQVCQIQRSVNPAAGWTTLDLRTVPEDGLLEYTDPDPRPEAAFYRIVPP
jgi:hypothetical protein